MSHTTDISADPHVQFPSHLTQQTVSYALSFDIYIRTFSSLLLVRTDSVIF